MTLKMVADKRVKGESRIQGYDLARGFAGLLMLVINFTQLFSSRRGLDGAALYFNYLDRRAAVVLVMVAGAGVSLLARRIGDSSRSVLIRRAVFLFIAGLFLSPVWNGDILHFYGIFFLIGTCFSKVSNRWLILAAGVFWAGSFVQFLEVYDLWLENADMPGLGAQIYDLFFTGYFPVFPWASFFLSGMALGRMDMSKALNRKRLLIFGTVMLAGSEGFSWFIRQYPLLPAGWMAQIDLTVPTPFSVVSGLGSGFCIIALGLFFVGRLNRQILICFSAAGRSMLTLYIGHVLFLISWFVLKGFSGRQAHMISAGYAVLFFGLYAVTSAIWLKKFQNGPLEILMRRFFG